jgi:hypothetical protein
MEEPVDAFVRHFCGGADAEVRAYVHGALAAAGEEGAADAVAAGALAEALLPFLPEGADARGFAAAAEQLLGLLAGGAAAGGAPAFEWLVPAAAEAEAVAEPAAADDKPAADKPAAAEPPPPAALGLSAAAAEFAPPPPPPPAEYDEDADAALARELAVADLGSQYWEEEEAADGWEYGDYGAAAAGYAPPGYGAASRGGGHGRAAAVRALLPALAAAPEGEALRLLGGHFPEYSAAALADVHAQCGGNFSATVAALCALEAELEGTALGAAERAAREAAAAAAAARRPAAFTADDFPTLGGGGGGGGAQPAPAAPAGGDYARRARAAAARPAPPPAPRPRASAAFASASSSAGARPAWEAGAEGVRRVSTGAAVAAEYADARAAAADHARLRNQLFQQATLAYQSGNRALAKELGARGRAENEAMHAAHAAAAGDTFARRNAAGGGGGCGEVVDLHGLHVGEALVALERSLAAARAARASGLRVVVGVGAHARPGAARLPDAARAWLVARGLEHRERFAGMLDVALRY